MRNTSWQNAAWGTMMIYLSANHTFVQDASGSLNFVLNAETCHYDKRFAKVIIISIIRNKLSRNLDFYLINVAFCG